jgi:hypothetical protein
MSAIRFAWLAAGLVAALTGCGGGPGTRDAAATSTGACQADSLTVEVDANQAGAAMGSTYVPIDFTNTSAAACDLNGFPSVEFVSQPSRDGHGLGATAQQDPGFDAVMVPVGPGGHAHAWLQVSAAGDYPAATCQPTEATWLRVDPPGGDGSGYARVRLTACSAPSAAQLTVMPVRAGLGSRGATP